MVEAGEEGSAEEDESENAKTSPPDCTGETMTKAQLEAIGVYIEAVDVANRATYSTRGFTECKSCPSGHICPGAHEPPTLCALGEVPSDDARTCKQCSEGTACPGPDKEPEKCDQPTE